MIQIQLGYIQSLKQELNPEFPSIVDGLCWEVGREYCNPRKPKCNTCPFADFCKKEIMSENRCLEVNIMEEGYTAISDQIAVKVNIAAIILGADETLLSLDAVDGFSFNKILLNEFKYKDKILLANNKLNNKYYLSQIQSDLNNKDNSSFVCLIKEDSFNVNGPDFIGKEVISISDKSMSLPELEEYQEKQFELINRLLSKLMLLKVADIGIYEVFCQFSYRYFIVNNNNMHTVTIDDAKTIVTKKFHINTEELTQFNNFLSTHNNSYNLMKKIIDGYTYSFKLLESAKSFEELVSVLEILLLPKNQKNKKETLSKRTAVLLGNDDTEIDTIYNKVQSFYKFRSESTHEGVYDNVGETELIELKELTRLSILKYMSEIEKLMNSNPMLTFDDFKRQKVATLINEVKNKINAGVLPA